MMPHDVGTNRPNPRFFHTILVGIVFAEIALSGGIHFADVAGGKVLPTATSLTSSPAFFRRMPAPAIVHML